MPLVNIDQVDYSKLPDSLLGGAFNLSHSHGDSRDGAYYKFHDKLWMADTRHLLGWSRQAIHSLEKLGTHEDEYLPDWLFGHSFRRSVGEYGVSAVDQKYSRAQMLALAHETHDKLTAAGVTIDQWNNSDHEAWHDNLLEHCSQRHLLYKIAIEKKWVTPLQLHTIHQNHANFQFHPSYAHEGIGQAVIQLPRSAEDAARMADALRAIQNMASGIGQTHANLPVITMDFQATAETGAATEYLAVFTVAPSDTGVGTEVSTSNTAYARISITMNATNFTPIATGTVLLAIVETYAVCAGGSNYGTVTDVALMAAVSGGSQPFYWGDTNAPVVINTGNQLSFPANSITFAYV